MIYPPDKRIGERILVGFIKDDRPYIIRTFHVQMDEFKPLQRFEITTRDNEAAVVVSIDRYDETEETVIKITDDIQPDELIVYLAGLIGE